jgi:tetratricopeptide (TPR) repeat protein
MPFTYNGVGTHYHGHHNSERRAGNCQACGRGGELESYNTRLWFVVFFIPIIPLGRKRIIDQCRYCRRHYMADADQWETQKQLNVSGAMETYRADPTPEKAMAAYQQLINFHQATQAIEFRKEIEVKFSQSAKLLAYLGMATAVKGMAEESAKYFHRAFELRPDLPEARIGIAREHIRLGRLNEARQMLDFLEKPGAGQLYSLEPLETLANAYQRAAKAEPALELFQCLLTALPRIGEIPGFRKRVQACEKVLGRKQSILPKWKFSWKNLFRRGPAQPRQGIRITWRGLATCGVVVAIFVGLLAVHSFYQSHHRSLFIVNGFKDPATVEVRGQNAVEVPGHGERKLTLPEGTYHVSIKGPVHQEEDVTLTANGSPSRPIWLLNVGGRALLLEERVTYKPGSPPPPELRAHFGEAFERIDDVSHPFETLPQSIQMNSNEGQRVLTSLEFSKAKVDELLNWFAVRNRKAEELRLAEWRIQVQPDDAEALSVFVELAKPSHAEEVLHAGLMRRPVAMNWHRVYQNLHSNADWYGWLTVAYDGMLKDDPGNSALLYLRGRIEPKPGESTLWFLKARDADPKNPFVYYALGYASASGFAETLFQSRLALQDYAPLEKDLQVAISRTPLDFNRKIQLIKVLLAQSRGAEAAKIVTGAQQQAQAMQAQDAGALSGFQALNWEYCYAAGDFTKLEQSATKNSSLPGARNTLFVALLEQGKIAEALRATPLDKPKVDDAGTLLTVVLVYLAAHDNQQAQVWLKRAVDLMRTGSPDMARAAALFGDDAVLTPESIRAVELDWKVKSVVLTTLGMLHPEKRQEFFAAARRLNVDLSYPYHLVRRLTTETH